MYVCTYIYVNIYRERGREKRERERAHLDPDAGGEVDKRLRVQHHARVRLRSRRIHSSIQENTVRNLRTTTRAAGGKRLSASVEGLGLRF